MMVVGVVFNFFELLSLCGARCFRLLLVLDMFMPVSDLYDGSGAITIRRCSS